MNKIYTVQFKLDAYDNKFKWVLLDLNNKPLEQFSSKVKELADKTAQDLNQLLKEQ